MKPPADALPGAGLTIRPPQPLPDDLQALCDAAGPAGVCLVSMGSSAGGAVSGEAHSCLVSSLQLGHSRSGAQP